ncbi:caspase family protein [Phytohabitans aurantiacus]|uniref:Peptidase C14 caspase domain-containing protein n=1 Tax=Phytohabitans aurantiacus TaxID=3016789 RepID=A0ABQ5QZF0_9ACTN|nr:caspase family protein [Phytohabitans aurantiacus]GLH99928.1 hypothetical protein Pa4123_52040 [Phytohabitans aurantiacus]
MLEIDNEMQTSEVGGRYFIGLATSKHPNHPELDDRLELVDAVRDVRRLFTAELGYQSVPGFEPDLNIDDVRRLLGEFLTDERRTEADTVVLYYTGHGLVDGDEYLFPFPETTPDVWRTGLPSATLASWIFRGTQVCRFLVILDTCYAGAAGADLARESIRHLSRLAGPGKSPSVIVIAAARDRQYATSRAFTDGLLQAIRHPSAGGHEPQFLPIDSIMRKVDETTPDWQHVTVFRTGEPGGVDELLPNPRFSPHGRDLDLRTRDALQEKLRETELDSHVWPRAQGLDMPMDDRWLFTGRDAAMSYICRWLVEGNGSSLVVTGGPGSGKSSLLARLFVLSDPVYRKRIPGSDEMSAQAIPPDGSIRRFIHARSKTAEEVLAGLAEAVQATANSIVELLTIMKRRSGPPTTVIVDAVDEGSDPATLVHEILAPIARNGPQCGLRLLVGTRAHLLPELICPSIDIDSEEFADPASVRLYARRCLLEIVPTSPYRQAPATVTSAVAEAIGTASGKSFLVALITSRSLALRSSVVAEPYDPRWRADLPKKAAVAMERDINERLGVLAQKARDLLTPLAYAEGAGLPWENVWARVSSMVSGRLCRDNDIEWLIRHAGYYIIEAQEDHRSSYRLYHEALAEYLRGSEGTGGERDHQEIHRRFLHGLRSTVDGQDWRGAHPYVRRHLATHAAKAGEVDDYLLNPHYLPCADRSRLLAAAATAATAPGRRAALAFQQAMHASIDDFETRVAYLEQAACQYEAAELARNIRVSGLQASWRTLHAEWAPSPPHRVLCRLGTAVDTVGVTMMAGKPCVIAGTSTSVLAWDLDSELPLGEATLPKTRAGTGRLVPPTATDQDGGPFSYQLGRRLYSVGFDSGGPWIRQLRWPIPLSSSAATICAADGLYTVFVIGKNRTQARVLNSVGSRTRGDLDLRGHPRLWVGSAPAIDHLAVLRSKGTDLLVTGDGRGGVAAWNVATSQRLAAWRGADGPLSFVLGSELDGRPVVVTVSRIGDGVADIEESADIAAALRTVSQQEAQGLQSAVARRQRVTIYPILDAIPEAVAEYEIEEPVSAVAAACVDGRSFVITGSTDGTLRVRDMASGRLEFASPRGHVGPVTSLATFHTTTASVIVSGGGDGTVRLWDLGHHLPSDDLQTNVQRHWSVALSGTDERQLVVTGAEEVSARFSPRLPSHLLRIHAAATGQAQPTLQRPGGPVAMISTVEHNDQQFALTTAAQDCMVYSWDLTRGLLDQWMAHTRRITALAATVIDGEVVAITASEDGTVKAWNLATGLLRRVVWRGRRDFPNAVAVVPLHSRCALLVGTAKGNVGLVDISTGRSLGASITLRRRIESIAIDMSSNRAVARVHEGCVAITLSNRSGLRRWLPGSPVILTAPAAADLPVAAVAVSPRGLFAIASGDRIILGDGETGEMRQINVWSTVQSVAISDDGTVAAAAADGLVVLRLADANWRREARAGTPARELVQILRARGTLADLAGPDARENSGNLPAAGLEAFSEAPPVTDLEATDDSWADLPFNAVGPYSVATRIIAGTLFLALAWLLVFVPVLDSRSNSRARPEYPVVDLVFNLRLICEPTSPLFVPRLPVCGPYWTRND